MSLDAFQVPGSFDDLISRFFGGDPFAGRPVERVDLSRLLSADASALLQRAAEQAAARDSPYLNVEHLLWAAAQSDPTRRILDASGADPDELARRMEAAVPKGEPRDEVPPLAPAAKRALLAAHTESRRSGATYIGPEHILLGIAANPETAAGKALRALAGGVTEHAGPPAVRAGARRAPRPGRVRARPHRRRQSRAAGSRRRARRRDRRHDRGAVAAYQKRIMLVSSPNRAAASARASAPGAGGAHGRHRRGGQQPHATCSTPCCRCSTTVASPTRRAGPSTSATPF